MISRSFLILICFLPVSVTANQLGVEFDVPIICSAKTVEPQAADHSSTLKIIEVVIPVSPRVDRNNRGSIQEFQFDIFWNRNVYPLAEYAPRTRTTSSIDGPIAVERRSERNQSIGIDLKSGYSDAITGSASAKLGNSRSDSQRFNEIPQHDVLIASGTIHRGTGAFFRFHPSRTETLEGGRELVVAFRVPQSWRAGILQINCAAGGQKKVAGLWNESIQVDRSFVMPIYLEGDDQARHLATELVRSQIKLRQAWSRQTRQNSSSRLRLEMDSLLRREPLVPYSFADVMIQSGNRRVIDRYENQISDDVRRASSNFVAARERLEPLSR